MNQQRITDYAMLLLWSLCIGSCSLSAYDRDHNVHALYHIDRANLDEFCDSEGITYSLMKYGDRKAIRHYAKALAALIWEEHGHELRATPDQWRVIAPAAFTLQTSAIAVTQALVDVLRSDYDCPVLLEQLSRAGVSVEDFGSLASSTERQQHISGNFAYGGESLEDLSIIFVEDALVSGAHFIESQRVLSEQAGADLDRLFAYFIADVDQSDSLAKGSIEGAINHVWIQRDNAAHLCELMADNTSLISPRVLKLILAPNGDLGDYLAKLPQAVLLRVYESALADGFDSKAEFAPALEQLAYAIGAKLGPQPIWVCALPPRRLAARRPGYQSAL